MKKLCSNKDRKGEVVSVRVLSKKMQVKITTWTGSVENLIVSYYYHGGLLSLQDLQLNASYHFSIIE